MQKRQIKEAKNPVLGLHAALVMVEVKAIDAGLSLQVRTLEAALDGPAVTGFQFHVGEPL
jgi:hypothetical protein